MKKIELLARIAALEARVRVLEARHVLQYSPTLPADSFTRTFPADAVTISAGVAMTPERAAEIAASIVTAKARC